MDPTTYHAAHILFTATERGDFDPGTLILSVGSVLAPAVRDTELRLKAGAQFLNEMADVANINWPLDGDLTYDARPVLATLAEMHVVTSTNIRPMKEPWPIIEGNFTPKGEQIVRSPAHSQPTAVMLKALNKQVQSAWTVNKDMLAIVEAMFEASQIPDLNEGTKEARRSKRGQLRAVISLAKEYAEAPFYFARFFDFRGRLYNSTAFLTDQGSDVVKSLLLPAAVKPMGVKGLYWLYYSLATLAGIGTVYGPKSDKLLPDTRVEWARGQHELWLATARGEGDWLSMSEPFSLRAACLEFARYIAEGSRPEQFMTALTVAFDATCSGYQHLSLLTLDERTGRETNLTATDRLGDLYAVVGAALKAEIEKEWSALTERQREAAQSASEGYIELQAALKLKTIDSSVLLDFCKAREKDIKELAPIYVWSKIQSPSEWRKIVKRAVMTRPYGSTAYGVQEQLLDDLGGFGIDALKIMHGSWVRWLGKRLFVATAEVGVRAMNALCAFSNAGDAAGKKAVQLVWTVPGTGFRVVQHYKKPPKRTFTIDVLGHPRKLQVPVRELSKVDQNKQRSAAAPNIVHSLDAAHLIRVVNACDFHVTTIHDSFASHLADATELQNTLRREMVAMYTETDVLADVCAQIGVPPPQKGGLIPEEILGNPFTFS
jgi:DNA-directed RNA polymerase